MLLTRAPLYSGYCYPFLVDLHVLGTPPAFVLSQDQTLRCSLKFKLPLLSLKLSFVVRLHELVSQGEYSTSIDVWLCTLFVKEHSKTRF